MARVSDAITVAELRQHLEALGPSNQDCRVFALTQVNDELEDFAVPIIGVSRGEVAEGNQTGVLTPAWPWVDDATKIVWLRTKADWWLGPMAGGSAEEGKWS